MRRMGAGFWALGPAFSIDVGPNDERRAVQFKRVVVANIVRIQWETE
jgi:hypothetical protein